MDRDLVGRVSGSGLLALLPLAAAAAYWAGLPAFLGVLTGGAVAWGSLLWLSATSRGALALFRGGRVHPLWLLALGARHLCLFGVLGILLWSGYVHPVGVIVGVAAFPPVLILQALRTTGGAP